MPVKMGVVCKRQFSELYRSVRDTWEHAFRCFDCVVLIFERVLEPSCEFNSWLIETEGLNDVRCGRPIVVVLLLNFYILTAKL